MRNKIFSGPMYGFELTAGLVRRNHPDLCGFDGDSCSSDLGGIGWRPGGWEGGVPRGLLSLSLPGWGRLSLVNVGGGPSLGGWN